MRILMLNNEFPPLGGGTSSVNFELLKRFASRGLETDLVTSSPTQRYETERFSSSIRIFKVPVGVTCFHHATNPQLIRYAARGLRVASKLKRERRYDLCFAWCTFPAGVMALAIKAFAGLPYLVRVSGPDIPGFEARYDAVLRLLGPLARAAWSNARAVVVKSLAEIELMKKAAPFVSVTTIRNGVDMSSFRPAAISTDGPLRLLCVGRLIKRKGQNLLFQALHKLGEEGIKPHLTLVGEGDEEAAYRQQVRQLGLEKQVLFRGSVPRDDMAACYEQADVFVLPSYHEGMSVAALEAMASGLPLVLSDGAEKNELLFEGMNGFRMRPGDVPGLVEILRIAAGRREMLQSMGSAGRTKSAEFSWEKVVENYIQLFQVFTK